MNQESIFQFSPKEWKVDRLKDCLTNIVGGDWGEELFSDISGEDLVVLRVTNFDDLYINKKELTHRRIKHTKISHRLVSEKSLLLEKSGGGERQNVGRVVYTGQLPFRAICSNFIAKLDVCSNCNVKFLNYIFSALYAMDANQPHIRQTTGIQNLSVIHYLDTKVALPPLEEQRLIVAYLDSSCVAIDRAVEKKTKQLEILYELRKSIIHKAVTQGLNLDVEMKNSGIDWAGKIPIHWEVKKLKRLFSQVDYGVSVSTKQEGRYTVLKMGNIVAGEIVFSKLGYIDEVSPYLILDKDDLLYNRTNSLDQVAKVAIFRGTKDDEVTFASYLVRLRTNCRNDPHYFNFLLNTDVFIGLARKMAIPSVQQANLNPTRYCRLEVPIPPLHEQVTIRKFLEQKTSEIKSLEDVLNSQIKTMVDYRKSLIYECVTGKRRISKDDLIKVGANV